MRERVITTLPSEYAEWQASHLHSAPPTDYSPHCPNDAESKTEPLVTFPRSNERFAIDPGTATEHQRIRLTVHVPSPVNEVTWYVDGKEIGKASWPYAITWQLSPGSHTVEVAISGARSQGVPFLVL